MPRIRPLLSALIVAAMAAVPAATRLAAHDEFRFVGEVTKVDTPKNQVSVKYKESGKDETVVVTLTAKTEITRDKKPVPKSQVRIGVHVVVDALGCDDDYEAVAIKIVPAPAAR
jgi:hypothetical protein